MKPHRGTLILVFGILSLVVCAPLGIFAWIMGGNDLREMDAGLMDPAGRPNTSAGRICGIIGTALFVLQLLAVICLVAFGMFFSVARVQNTQHSPTITFPPPAQR